MIILAVKPYQVAEVLRAVKKDITTKKILISVVTGVLIAEMEELVARPVACFRAMPNTAIAIRESMTCICSKNADAQTSAYVHELFGQLGKVAQIDEKLMEASTVLAACGTAYAMRYIRANIQGGSRSGLMLQPLRS